jgi:phage baseplate assembly protein W
MARQLSIEDGNLSGSIITSRDRKYSDIDLLFENKPSGDIYVKEDAAAVKQSVKNIISTNLYEKPFNMDYGTDITGELFDLVDPYTQSQIKDEIGYNIAKYEPRAAILDIYCNANPDAHTLYVQVTFRVKSTGKIITLDTTVARLR